MTVVSGNKITLHANTANIQQVARSSGVSCTHPQGRTQVGRSRARVPGSWAWMSPECGLGGVRCLQSRREILRIKGFLGWDGDPITTAH